MVSGKLSFIESIKKTIHKKVEELNASGIVVNLSYGGNAPLLLFLSKEVVGASNLLGLVFSNTPEEISNELISFAEKMGVKTENIKVAELVVSFEEKLKESDATCSDYEYALKGLTARIGMLYSFYRAEQLNYLVASPLSRTQIKKGEFIKFAENAADLMPFGLISQSQCFNIANYLGVPKFLSLKRKTLKELKLMELPEKCRLNFPLEFEPPLVVDKLSRFLQNKLKEFNAKGVVFGLSGGLDSACVAGLLSQAIPKQNILALIMPERDTLPQNVKDAYMIAKTLGIKAKLVNLESILEKFGIYEGVPKFVHSKGARILTKMVYPLIPIKANPFLEGLKGTTKRWLRYINAYYRIKHRARMVCEYFVAEQLNYMVVGASNKTEELTGLFVKFGDDSADIALLADLYKTQVRKLSEWLCLPRTIIKKPPSPDLLPGITDELVLKVPYHLLDEILYGFEHNEWMEIIRKKVKPKLIEYVKELMERSAHMRKKY